MRASKAAAGPSFLPTQLYERAQIVHKLPPLLGRHVRQALGHLGVGVDEVVVVAPRPYGVKGAGIGGREREARQAGGRLYECKWG